MASFINVEIMDIFGNRIETIEYEQEIILRMAIEIHMRESSVEVYTPAVRLTV